MKVLVVVASKHGSTLEIGEKIVDILKGAGFECDYCTDPNTVQTLEGYDAVVVGSAVYITQWMESARSFISRFSSQLRQLPTWTFSVGMAGASKGKNSDNNRVGHAVLNINSISHGNFHGKLNMMELSLRERSIAKLGGAIEGDYRDWNKISAWADSIVEYLKNKQ